MKTLHNIMHAKLMVRVETLRGIFDKSEIFFVFKWKFFITSSNMYLNICEKSLTNVFIFCFKENWEKVPFLKVLDKETPLRESSYVTVGLFRFFGQFFWRIIKKSILKFPLHIFILRPENVSITMHKTISKFRPEIHSDSTPSWKLHSRRITISFTHSKNYLEQNFKPEKRKIEHLWYYKMMICVHFVCED